MISSFQHNITLRPVVAPIYVETVPLQAFKNPNIQRLNLELFSHKLLPCLGELGHQLLWRPIQVAKGVHAAGAAKRRPVKLAAKLIIQSLVFADDTHLRLMRIHTDEAILAPIAD